MGKFGIGARVRDDDGDEGVIVGKRKGEREVFYSHLGFSAWFDKSSLTAVLPATDDACAETCEVAYKVGDRVVFNDDMTSGVGVIVAKSPERRFDWSVRDEGGDAPSFYSDARFPFRTRHFSAADLRPFRLEAGRYYKTRDGRKVLVKDNDSSDAGVYPFFHDSGRHGFHGLTRDGLSCIGVAAYDIVADWVDPEADLKPWKVDDVPEVPPTPALTVVAGKRYRGKSGQIHDVIQNTGNSVWTLCSNTEPFVERRFWKADGTAYNIEGFSHATPGDPLVEELPAAPKFRVGDTVRHMTLGYVGEIKELVDGDFAETWWPSKGWGGTDPLDLLELVTAPTIDVGSEVILTAPARVTGFDKKNANIVLATGGSFALPIASLTAA